MNEQADILIIGGGIMGAAIFYHTAKLKNKKVLLLEKTHFCAGTTGQSGGFIRAFQSTLELTQLAADSFIDFTAPAEEINLACHFQKTGFVTLIPQKKLGDTKQRLALLKAQGISAEVFSHKDSALLRALGFDYQLTPDDCVIYEKEAGFADPRGVTHAYITAGRQHGGQALEGQAVQAITIDKQQVLGVDTTNHT